MPLKAYSKRPFAFEGSVEESVWWRAVLSAREGNAFVIVEDTNRERTQAEHDFIAAADPSTILSLLDENEELREHLRAVLDHMDCPCESSGCDASAARAALSEET